MDEQAVVARRSLSVGFWTIVSRATGLARVATIAAVLGPTYLGNTFLAMNLLPNLTFEFLTGSLFATLLVPPLVRHASQRKEAERIAGGFLSIALVATAIVTALAVLAGPLLLRLLALGVSDSETAAAQRHVGSLLLAMLMPQIVLYAIAGIGAAVMNSRGRFALAAAAPAFENLGVIATLGVVAGVFGVDATLATVSNAELLVLGLGTTAAVGLHAAAQAIGAFRVGVRLVPRAGWRDAEVRAIVRRGVLSVGYSGLNTLRIFGAVVVSNSVAGGVVAFQIALNFFYLPIAIGARPVATALLPRLARLHHDRARFLFRDELSHGAALVALLVVPAAVAYAALSLPIARAVSFGQMGGSHGVTMLAAALAALAPGVLGEAAFVLATYASYARYDARAPLRSMMLRTGVSFVGMAVAFVASRNVVLVVALGLALSAGNVASAWHLVRRVRSALPPGGPALAPAIARAVAASVAMVGAAYGVTAGLGAVAAHDIVVVLVAVILGAAVFIGVERACGAPELDVLRRGLRQVRPGGESA
jgi:putative peptidoglycan lipid II flippase